MRQQIIKQIKSELHMLEVSSLPHEFDKHLYAVETLIGVLKGQKPDAEAAPKYKGSEPAMTEKDEKMLELMGGTGKEKARPDDKSNGDSIFDF